MEILMFPGVALAFIGFVWLLVVAFRTSLLWALACFIPFGALFFALLHWEDSKGAFLTSLLGGVLIFFASR